MAHERKRIETVEELTMIIGASHKKYITAEEGAFMFSMGIHAFEKFAGDAGAKRKIGSRALYNMAKVEEYFETMFSE